MTTSGPSTAMSAPSPITCTRSSPTSDTPICTILRPACSKSSVAKPHDTWCARRKKQRRECSGPRCCLRSLGSRITVLLIETFQFLKTQDRPVLLHAITQKGRGFQPALDKQKKFHGLGPYDPDTGETKSAGQKTYSEIFAEAL